MCQSGARNPVSMMNTNCDCECNCPVLLPIVDEIRHLEEHKKTLASMIDEINTKISALKSANS